MLDILYSRFPIVNALRQVALGDAMTSKHTPGSPANKTAGYRKKAAGRKILWFAENSDALAALLLGLTAVMLGLFSTVNQDVLDNCILGTLAVLSFALLRDRWTSDSADQATREAVKKVIEACAPLQSTSTDLENLKLSVDHISMTVEGLATVETLKGTRLLEPVFAQAREETAHWTFRGGTGTYTRAMTLPECVAKARDRVPHRGLDVRLQILDPLNVPLCAMYAEYRATVPPRVDGTDEPWTTDRTQKESFATVLAAGWHKRSYSLLNIGVYLMSTMSTLRYDLSDSMIIITQDHPQFPAMVISKNNPHYYAYVTEINTSQQQARSAAIEGPHMQLTDPLTEDKVRQFFIDAHLPLPDSFTEGDVKQIIDKAIHAKNPYAK
jgi:hypothetical protein